MVNVFRNKQGIGIAMTLLAIVLISILGTALIFRSISLSHVINHKNYSITALQAAKAGISFGIYAVEEDMNFKDDIGIPGDPASANFKSQVEALEVPGYDDEISSVVERGYYTVEIENNLSATEGFLTLTPYIGEDVKVPPGAVGVLSTGYAGDPRDSLHGYKKIAQVIAIGYKVVESSGQNYFRYAAYGDASVDLKGSGIGTDSFDSRIGPYPSGLGNMGNVGSNGEVNAGKSVDGNIDVTDPNNVNGISNASGVVNTVSPMDMTPPEIPDLPPAVIP